MGCLGAFVDTADGQPRYTLCVLIIKHCCRHLPSPLCPAGQALWLGVRIDGLTPFSFNSKTGWAVYGVSRRYGSLPITDNICSAIKNQTRGHGRPSWIRHLRYFAVAAYLSLLVSQSVTRPFWEASGQVGYFSPWGGAVFSSMWSRLHFIHPADSCTSKPW
ncbi:hypothetical protein BDY17DRAFT_145094 [Neohortaea acidophila]|uniref:Uncharacterized protein n=1 Tax=Neohortaea acidophila TaxID=245834 RepID=A0A6A6PTJ8_9PEZI|nr:uncharacterized protein BDY17DRAFT_145094 [Neohortaea acidophila]KAF2483312.1 hypothetical protein BDY17DRAFT_145094 [Neohortaea acidophila]